MVLKLLEFWNVRNQECLPLSIVADNGRYWNPKGWEPLPTSPNIPYVKCISCDFALGMHLQEMKDRNWGNCQATTADQFPLPNFKPPKLSEEMGFSFPFRDSPSVISIQIPIHPFCPALHRTAAYPADTRDYLSLGFLSKSDWIRWHDQRQTGIYLEVWSADIHLRSEGLWL